MELLFERNGFAAKIAQCQEVVIWDGPRRGPEDTYHASTTEHQRGVKYVDPETGNSIAVIFTYRNIIGETFRVIKMLRVGNIRYDVYVLPS